VTEEMLTLISGVTAAQSEDELLRSMNEAAVRMECDHVLFAFELRLPNLARVRHVTGACAKRGRAIQEEPHPFGLGHGVSLAVHDHGATVSVLSLARDRPFNHESDRKRVVDAGTVLAHCLHVASGRIVLPGILARERPALSPREKQCFQLVALGKSNWDIGQLLSISEETAAFHMKNVLKKFVVSSRTQAVAIGVALGMIT
jgi:DNA-binding CsgD family transcriptional regulator